MKSNQKFSLKTLPVIFMDKDEIIYNAKPWTLNHMMTTLLLIIALGGYFIGLQKFLLILTGIIAFIKMFDEEVSIYIYKDKFVIRYSNYFGKLMSTELIYFYSDIKKFDYTIDKWEAGSIQTLFVTVINLFLPGKQSSPLTRAPQAKITIEYLDNFKELYSKQIDFNYRGMRYSIALDKIKKQTEINYKNVISKQYGSKS